jgi:hypothetical protein
LGNTTVSVVAEFCMALAFLEDLRGGSD